MAQTTWIVDESGGGDFTTIQGCIDNASVVDGDTCRVNAGTYVENIDFSGKNITVKSTSGPGVTIIDGNAAGSVVTFENSETANAVLDGFTIRNGSASNGGGMYNDNSSPTVSNCTFSGNTANTHGGGMFNASSSSPTVSNCTFSGNTANTHGGGMFNNNSSPTVTNCTFSGNTAGAGGGGMRNDWSDPTVTNCTFSTNVANAGGGMSNYFGDPTVTNCTFSGNTATASGGGMNNKWYSDPTVTNCILWGDSPDEIYTIDDGTPSTPIVTYSDIQGGYGVPEDHNINNNPLFVNPDDGNFHLQQVSPCIDAGDNSAPSLPAHDFEGDDRIIDGDEDGIATVDMGIDEFTEEFPWILFYPAFIKKK